MAGQILAPSFKNKYPIFKQVNEKIKQINIESGLSFLNLHLEGIKMLNSGLNISSILGLVQPGYGEKLKCLENYIFTADNKLKII